MAEAKHILIVEIIFFTALFAMPVFANPVINSINFSPSGNSQENITSIWLGENVTAYVDCADNSNQTITGVYANLSGTVTASNIIFSNINGAWQSFLPESYIYSTGAYNFVFWCTDDTGNVSIATSSFSVSNLSGKISSISPTQIDSGSDITVYFDLRKDGSPISTGPVFHIFSDGNERNLTSNLPPQYSSRGWALQIGPESTGSHNLRVTADYSRMALSDSKPIDVQNSLIFTITAIDRTSLKTDDVITLTISASDNGQIIDLNSTGISFDIGGRYIAPSSLARSGNFYVAKLIAPSMNQGSYVLRAAMTYNGRAYESSKTVFYPISASGKIVDANDKSVTTQMDFLTGDTKSFSISTDSSGSFSTTIQPGSYDMRIKFPKATVFLQDVNVNSFTDPIKYDYVEGGLIEGFNSVVTFDFEFALPFTYSDIDMTYNDKLVDDEQNLSVFSCYNWNYGKRACNGNWSDIGFDRDTVRNIISVHGSTLYAFSIGTRQNLSSTFNTDRDSYSPDENVSISGVATGPGEERITGAIVSIFVKGTAIKAETKTGEIGDFVAEIPANLPDGEYTINVTVEKQPFVKFSSTKKITVAKRKELTLVMPSAIRTYAGNIANQDVEVQNNGQTMLTNIAFSITGIPKEWYTFDNSGFNLLPGEKKNVRILFNIPQSADANTTSISIITNSNEIRQEKKIGFSIAKNQTVDEPQAKAPSGEAISVKFPQIGFDYMIVLVFAVVAIPAALFFRFKKSNRSEIKGMLSEIRGQIDLRMRRNHIDNVEKNYSASESQRGVVNG